MFYSLIFSFANFKSKLNVKALTSPQLKFSDTFRVVQYCSIALLYTKKKQNVAVNVETIGGGIVTWVFGYMHTKTNGMLEAYSISNFYLFRANL